jgi:acyl-CoA synthetase (AMP-forming)/AMP-acid ligase II
MLVSDIVRRNAAVFGDRLAAIEPGARRVTWSELDERSNRLAHSLLSLGLGKGDRLAIFARNGITYLEFFFACAKTGIVGAPTNIRLSAYELTSYLRYVEPAALLADAELAEQVDDFTSEVQSLRHIVGFSGTHAWELDLEQLMAAQEPTDPGCALTDEDVYMLGPTSGTTGVPKGAILTHRNATAAMLNWAAEMPVLEGDTYLQCIPMFFNPGGPAGVHPVMLKGGRSVIVPGFDPGLFLQLVPEYSVTHSVAVPTMVQMILDHPDADHTDLSSLRAMTTGGSPVSRDFLLRANALFGKIFYPHFGMAETYSSGLVLRQEHQITDGDAEQTRRLGSAGKPAVFMMARVVDESGTDVPRDNTTSGELWIKGDSVSPGYYDMPDETAASRDGDWFKTGDVAVIDDDGFITIVDRMKDIIITGGINVFSREIEDAVMAHPAVAMCAVVGVPSERWGEAIHAVVVLRPGHEATIDDISAVAAERLAPFKKPRSVEIVDALPISGTGKILKRELRKQYWEGYERPI